MDAFYASVEQRDDPALRGRPVAVGGSRQRGVVAAASYEARRYGVRSAMSSMAAVRRCPELVFVKPRFDVYKGVSLQIRAILADYTALIEPLSLDEAYLDVTDATRCGSATGIAQEIRSRILSVTGLTASAGVSYNKFLAKLASDHRKPDGLTVIPPGQGERFVEALDVGRFHGVGPVTAARMNALGIFTGLDLRRQPPELLDAHFGKAGAYYYMAARAVDHRPVKPDRVRKSVGSESTFPEDLTDIRRPPRRIGAGRGGRLAPLRGDRPAWPDRDPQGQICGLSTGHAQPHRRPSGRRHRHACGASDGISWPRSCRREPAYACSACRFRTSKPRDAPEDPQLTLAL